MLKQVQHDGRFYLIILQEIINHKEEKRKCLIAREGSSEGVQGGGGGHRPPPCLWLEGFRKMNRKTVRRPKRGAAPKAATGANERSE